VVMYDKFLHLWEAGKTKIQFSPRSQNLDVIMYFKIRIVA